MNLMWDKSDRSGNHTRAEGWLVPWGMAAVPSRVEGLMTGWGRLTGGHVNPLRWNF